MNLNENKHTAPSYDFGTYCESNADRKRKEYLKENFDLTEGREEVFGPHNGCPECEGTGWKPISYHDYNTPALLSLYSEAESHSKSSDGWHMVPCPGCTGTVHESLDEHIVSEGNDFVLKSKKEDKEISRFKKKTIKESAALPGDKESSQSSSNKSSNKTKEDPSEKEDNKDEKKAETKEKNEDSAEKKKSERERKKLLPYEFISQKDAERSGSHLGLHGSHNTGDGIYKPGTSENSLRDAIYNKKAKQKARGGINPRNTK